MTIKGIAKGDKDLRHFTFDDSNVVYKGGIPYYEVSYGKNPLEGEYGDDEIGYVECSKVIPLGGRKLKPIQTKQEKEVVAEPEPEPIKPAKRGRPAKNKKDRDIIPVSINGSFTYEYYVTEIKITDSKELQEKLNKLGSDGWELCCYDTNKSLFGNVHIMAIFKRKRD